MTFSKKVQTQQGNGAASGDWETYNNAVWAAFDVDSSVNAKGKEVKEGDVIGVLNFIQELGNQPLPPASMKSNFPVPAEGEDNSPEELARLVDYPNNWFAWDSEWKDGVKTQVRKVYWNQNPQETLVLAVDFPSIQVDYGLHPASPDGTDIKPFRIDYNGKYKGVFERTVTNTPNWKTGKFGDKDVKYKIATACGNLAEYQEDQHDLAHLVQATCNWRVVMDKNTDANGKTYFNVKIKEPTAIKDIKTRKDNYTVAEQLEDNKCDVAFCGILFDGSDYAKEDLLQVRDFWWEEAKKAVQFDKNEGTARTGNWFEGMDWKDSGLAKAYALHGFGENTPAQSSSQGNAATQSGGDGGSVPEKKEPAKVELSESGIDFDEDSIPFAPIGLPFNNSLLYVI